jgi:hypothetical protein
MPVTIASADVGKTAAGRGSKVVLCGGRAGIVQQDMVMQLGSDPCCMSGSQPVQGLPAPAAICACPCICAVMAAFDTS